MYTSSFSNQNDRQPTESESVKKLQTKPHQHLLVIVPALFPCLVVPLSVPLPLTDGRNLGWGPRFIFIIYNDARVGACLTAAGCPVPALEIAGEAIPRTF